MFSISYPADEHYRTPQSGGAPTYENAKQIISAKRRLVNLYAFNSSGSNLYLMVQDSANAGSDQGPLTVYPVPAGGFISVSAHGGERFENGIYLEAFQDTALATPAGSVMAYKVDWMAYL